MEAAPITITREDLATPWQRLGAVLLDGLIAVPFGIATAFVFFERDEVTGRVSFDAPLLFTVLSVLLFAAYEIVGTALWGQTVGKHVVGIRVCSGRDLDRPGWLRACKRWGIIAAAGQVPFVGGLLAFVIPLPLLWDQARQGLHDKFADTLVVQNRSVPWA